MKLALIFSGSNFLLPTTLLLHHHFFLCTLFQNLNVFLQHFFPILQSFLFRGSSLISCFRRLVRSLISGRRPASAMIPDLVRLQFHLSFLPFPLFELQFQIEFLNAPYFDRQCPVTDFFFDVLNILSRTFTSGIDGPGQFFFYKFRITGPDNLSVRIFWTID